MFNRVGLVISLNKTNQKSSIPKSIVVYFYIVQVLYGLNFGFHKHPKKKWIHLTLKILSVFVALAITFFSIRCVLPFDLDLFWFYIILIQYIAYFLVFLTTRYTVFDFISDIFKKFQDIPALSNNIIGIFINAYIVLLFIVKIIIMYISCKVFNLHQCSTRGNSFYFFLIPITCVDMISMTLVLILYYIRKCMSYIIASPMDPHFIKENYIAVASCYDKIVILYDKLEANDCFTETFITSLLFLQKVIEICIEVPKILVTLWNALVMIKVTSETGNHDNMMWISAGTHSFYLIWSIIHISAPSVVAEVINSSMDTLTLKLHTVLLDKQDDSVSRLLQYISARPLRHHTWRLMPMDMQLPIGLINLCVTYFIVILQFTHLYG